jgi:(2R)-3-sulfolactate dehydrogenase (NADP+)
MATMDGQAITSLAEGALQRAETRPDQARSLARAVAAAEMDGIRSHGLVYVPIYCEHVQCGKVNGTAVPTVEVTGTAAVTVDAANGFAHPAIDAGFAKLLPLARQHGIAAVSVRNSYNCGVLGYHVERLAAEGLVGLGFTNAPASIAPVGGARKVIGTNPFALAAPDGDGGAAFVLDQSASVVAKSEITLHAREGKPIPEGWAYDGDGNPTTDPEAALQGTMAPAGGYKGFGTGLMVELFAAVLAGATLGKDASPFAGTAGGPPATGQFFIAIDPASFSGAGFASRMTELASAITDQPGARLPGQRRLENRRRNLAAGGVEVDDALIGRIQAIT